MNRIISILEQLQQRIPDGAWNLEKEAGSGRIEILNEIAPALFEGFNAEDASQASLITADLTKKHPDYALAIISRMAHALYYRSRGELQEKINKEGAEEFLDNAHAQLLNAAEKNWQPGDSGWLSDVELPKALAMVAVSCAPYSNSEAAFADLCQKTFRGLEQRYAGSASYVFISDTIGYLLAFAAPDSRLRNISFGYWQNLLEQADNISDGAFLRTKRIKIALNNKIDETEALEDFFVYAIGKMEASEDLHLIAYHGLEILHAYFENNTHQEDLNFKAALEINNRILKYYFAASPLEALGTFRQYFDFISCDSERKKQTAQLLAQNILKQLASIYPSVRSGTQIDSLDNKFFKFLSDLEEYGYIAGQQVQDFRRTIEQNSSSATVAAKGEITGKNINRIRGQLLRSVKNRLSSFLGLFNWKRWFGRAKRPDSIRKGASSDSFDNQ